MAEVQVQDVSHRHEAIIDWLLAHPEVKNLEALCKELNYSRSWLSVVMNSDAFRERYAIRRAELNDGIVTRLSTKKLQVAEKALEKLDEILDEEDLKPSFVADTTLRMLSLLQQGAAPQRTVEREVTRETTRMVSRDVLVRARETVRTVQNVPALPAPGDFSDEVHSTTG